MRRRAVLLLTVMTATLVAVLMASGLAQAAATTFTVNSTADPGDGTCNASECTLREAINAANSTSGAGTIKFNIPGPGPHPISPTSKLPDITDPVTIDGYSQPGSKPNALAVGNDAQLMIELSGADPGVAGASGLKIKSANSTVKGLVINSWEESGVVLDGTAGAEFNKVTGNYIGTDVTGTVINPDGIPFNGDELGNNAGVVIVNAPNSTIGGMKPAAHNIISGNGAGINITGGTGNKVQGNYIGTDKDGTSALGNTNGVVIDAAPNNTIGGTKAAARNIISGNSVFGIRIAFLGTTGNQVQGNYIGTKANGTEPLGNGNDGVSIQTSAANNTIGGTKSAARNIISGNGGDGVEIIFDNIDFPNAATGNRILRNSIYDNAKLGIDLVHSNDPPGVTDNDDDDGDAGPNNLQNFPEDLSATRSGKTTTIEGILNSTANTEFTIQFFSSPAADDSNHGEGKTFLGQKSVATDEDGNASFSFAASSNKIPSGGVVSATATNKATGDTSEFSQAVTVG